MVFSVADPFCDQSVAVVVNAGKLRGMRLLRCVSVTDDISKEVACLTWKFGNPELEDKSQSKFRLPETGKTIDFGQLCTLSQSILFISLCWQ